MSSAVGRYLIRSLFASSALALPAIVHAQEYFPPAPPPIRETIDANGVDLARGTVVSRSHSVSIGGPGGSGLNWSRTITSNGDFRDSTGASITSASGVTTVSIGNHSESFTLSGGNYVSVDKTGATLVASGSDRIFTTADGVIYTFVLPGYFKFQYAGNMALSEVVWPTGERHVYGYEESTFCIHQIGGECVAEVTVARLRAVTATTGHALRFDFASNLVGGTNQTKPWMTVNKVTAYNMAVDYCDPLATSCTFSQTWPTLTISGVTSFTDSLNRTTNYTYTSGVLTGVKRPGSATNNVTIAYTNAKASQVTNEGVVTNYASADLSGVRTTTISDAAAGDRVVKTDLATMLVSSDTNEAAKLTAYEYYPTSGLLKKVTAPELNTAEFEYDARGNVTKTTLTPKPGSSLAPVVTTATYPASHATETWRCATAPAVTCNKPLTSTDPRGHVTNYAWDATTGQPTAVTQPAPAGGGVRPETRYGYTSTLFAQHKNSLGNLVNFATPLTRLTSVSACQTLSACAGAADEAKSTVTYGTANVLPTSVASGSGNGSLTATTAFTYDSIGNRLTVDGPLAGTADTSRTRYDAGRQVIGVVGPDPDGAGALKHRARRLTYNLDGQVTKAESGTVIGTSDPDWANFVSLEAVETAYDANARAVTQKLTSGGTTYALTQTSYDALGRLDCIATRMNPAIYGSLPASACTLGTQGTAGPDRIAQTSYDPVSRPIKATVALGTADQSDEVTATYTDNGKVGSVKDAENNLTTYEYDGLDRVTKTRMPVPTQGANASSTTDYEQPTYDAASNVTALRLRDGQSIALAYDTLNRLTGKDLPGAESDVAYAYDNLGRLTSASQTGNILGFSYDALSRNLTQTSPRGTLTSQYDLAGRRTKLTHPDAFFVDQDYLVTGELTKVRENGAASGLGVLATFAYDDLGRTTSLTRGNGAVTSYAFDPVSRLATLTDNPANTSHDQTLGFDYNPASQITQTTRSNDLYAWTGHGSGTTNSTANGLNQLTQIGVATTTHDARGNLTGDGTRTFGYSSENFLTTANGGVSLNYDPLMRLERITAASITGFAYDGLDLVAEYDAVGARTKRYVHGANLDQPMVEYDGSATTTKRWLHNDERGSVVALSDTNGAVTSINRYDEYGKPQATNTGRFQYTGQIWLPEIARYYYKTRMYDPAGGGRFMQTDWIGYAGGMNAYIYVGNDPVNFIDPLGTMCTIINRGKSWYQLMNDGSLGPYLGPVKGSEWVQTFGDCGGGGGTDPREGPGRGDLPDKPEKEKKPTLRSKKYICEKLASSKYNVKDAWTKANADRHSKTNGTSNWNNPIYREGENWLTAAAGFHPGGLRIFIYLHQYQKMLPFSETTPFSQEALDAGLYGDSHEGDSPAKLKRWCNAK